MILLAVLAAGPTSADPPAGEAAAAHTLGMHLRRQGGPDALENALPWLQRASDLAPDNSGFLGDYGGTCLELADLHRSYSLATRGREALERTLILDPNDLEARDGLMQFFARAPWPLGNRDRAIAEAREIGRRNPRKGADSEYRLGAIFEKNGDRDEAKAAYREALRLRPDHEKAAHALTRLP